MTSSLNFKYIFLMGCARRSANPKNSHGHAHWKTAAIMANTKIPGRYETGPSILLQSWGYIQLPSTCFAGFQATTELRQDEHFQILGIVEFVRQEKVDVENIHLKIRFISRIIKIYNLCDIHPPTNPRRNIFIWKNPHFRQFETQMTWNFETHRCYNHRQGMIRCYRNGNHFIE